MEDAFNLDDISEEQTLERLESLFESTTNFPELDANFESTFDQATGGLSNESSNAGTPAGNVGSGGDGGGLLGLDAASADIFGNATSHQTPDTNQPMSFQGQLASQPVATAQLAEQAKPLPFATKSAPTSTILAPRSQPVNVASAGAPLIRATSAPLSTAAAAVSSLTQPLQRMPGPTATTLAPKQPQILPKPLSTKVAKRQPGAAVATVVSSAPNVVVSTSHLQNTVTVSMPSLILNQQGNVLATSQQGAPLLLNNIVGQVVGQPQQQQQQLFIQQPTQPGQQPMLIMRPQQATAQATLIPTAQSGSAGTILLQQQPDAAAASAAAMITAQPQVKIITPQGRMQMQQIQTPTGSRLIAVPVGQTVGQAVQVQAQQVAATSPLVTSLPSSFSGTIQGLQPTTAGLITAQAANPIQLSGLPTVIATSAPQPAVASLSEPQTPTSSKTPTGSKKKKSKKRRDKEAKDAAAAVLASANAAAAAAAAQSAAQTAVLGSSLSAPATSTAAGGVKKGVDLGELMKDVGLDLDGFGMEEPSSTTAGNATSDPFAPAAGGTVGSNLSFTALEPQPMQPSQSAGQPGSSGSQLVAQIQQPLPIQPQTGSQLQLVQGPDGQYMLQNALPTTPTILTHASLAGQQPTSLLGQSQQLLTQSPMTVTAMTPQGIPTQVVMATPTHQQHQQQQQLAAAAAATQVAPTPTILTPSTSTATPTSSGPRSPTKVIRPRLTQDPARVPLYEDDRLPKGWHRKVSQRKSGASAGRYEVFIIGPTGKRFRSRNELKAFFDKTGETNLDSEDFDFSTFGTGTVRSAVQASAGPSSSGSIASATESKQSNLPQPSAPTTTVLAPNSSSNPPLITSGAQPLPLSQASMPAPPVNKAVSVVSSSSAPAPLNPNLVQSLTQPLPQNSLGSQPQQPGSNLLPAPAPQFSTQMSRDTAEADAQISQLIETLHKDPQSLEIESDKMADFLKSLQGSDTPTPAASSATDPFNRNPGPNPSTSTSSTPSAGSMTKPKVTPEKTSGTTGFQASFLNSLAKSGDRESNPPSPVETPPLPPPTVTPVPTANTPQPAMPVLPQTPNPPISMPQQLRGMGPLPPNTRLVKGPNGQLTLQKVQTIELTPEQQNNLRVVQVRLAELERKAARSAAEEAEIVTLQTKQQQILASGRPVAATATQNPADSQPQPMSMPQLAPQQAVTSQAAMQNQLSLSTATRVVPSSQMPQVSQHFMPQYPSSQEPMASVTPTATPQLPTQPAPQQHPQVQPPSVLQPTPLSQMPPPQPISQLPKLLKNATGAITYPPISLQSLVAAQNQVVTSSAQANPVVPQQPQGHAGAAPLPMVSGLIDPSSATGLPFSTGAGRANIPPLTDKQKKVISEFKAKMATLPPGQQAAFVAQNKTNLIRALNFQPQQLQQLRAGATPAAGMAAVATPGVVVPEAASASQVGVIMPAVTAAPEKPRPVILDNATSSPTLVAGVKRPFPQEPAAIMKQPLPQQQQAVLTAAPGQSAIKQKKTAWIESQMKRDQHEAVNVNYKLPFKSREDAVKRLLRYHVFYELDPDPMEVEREEEEYEDKAAETLDKFHGMVNKYHFLLTQEAKRMTSSSEDVMLARMWDSDERQSLYQEKENYKAGIITELPPFPESWADKYEELTGHRPPKEGLKFPEPEVPAEIPVQTPVETPVEVPGPTQENGSLNGPAMLSPGDEMPFPPNTEPVQYTSTSSSQNPAKIPLLPLDSGLGAGNSSDKEDEEDIDPFPNPPQRIIPACGSVDSSEDDSQRSGQFNSGHFSQEDENSDEEFSLKDMASAEAVGSMLGGHGHGHHAGALPQGQGATEEDFDLHFGRFDGGVDTPTLINAAAGVASAVASAEDSDVQSAINSILDCGTGERMETPDLSNITGLLDSMEREDAAAGETDAATAAAVNSIPDF